MLEIYSWTKKSERSWEWYLNERLVLYKVSDFFLSCLLYKRHFRAFIFNSLNLGMIVSRTTYPRNVEKSWGELILHTILTIAGVVLWTLKVSNSVRGSIQDMHRENPVKIGVFLTFIRIFIFFEKICHATPHSLNTAIFRTHLCAYSKRTNDIHLKKNVLNWNDIWICFAPCNFIEVTSFRFFLSVSI